MDKFDIQVLLKLWNHFFPSDPEFDGTHPKFNVIQTMRKSIQSNHVVYDQLIKKFTNISFEITDLEKMLSFDDFEATLIHQPNEILGCLGIALSWISTILHYSGDDIKVTIVSPSITKLSNLIHFSNLKSSKVGRLVMIEGYVVRVSTIKPLVLNAKFSCNKCHSSQDATFEDGIFHQPEKCINTQCKYKYGMELIRGSVVTIPYQRLKIQEVDDLSDDSSARIPRTFEIEARGEWLVNKCRVGDLISVVGIIKTFQLDIQRVSKQFIKDGGLHQLYAVANSLTLSKSTAHSNKLAVPGNFLSKIREIALSGMCLPLLCSSLCPGIYGHELVKAGLLLALFGGSFRSRENTSPVNTRSDIHVLMIGDPGIGKSQLLRSCVYVASRGLLVCGNTSTSAGLTVTVGREGRDTSIEAGALVLADQGVCCIDELDKLSCDYHALLEAMEQQRISVAKGGVVTSLKSRASILAAANPVSGSYQRNRTISENLKMPTSLLSRFDLVFLMLDKPEEFHDKRVGEHILSLHKSSTTPSTTTLDWNQPILVKENEIIDEMTIQQRLRRDCDKISMSSQCIPNHILKEYIEYARKYCSPKLTKEAAKVLQKLYLTLRAQAHMGQSMPVTTRHLESLIRLAEARAKLELREVVQESDAVDVVLMLQESVLEAFTNDMSGEVEFGRKGSGGLSKQVKSVVNCLNLEARKRPNRKLFSKSEIAEVLLRLQVNRDVDSFIDILRTECYLLLKGPNLYQLQLS